MTACTWTPSCREEARHKVRSHTRPGLVLTFHVCDRHRPVALAQGYHLWGDEGPDEDQDENAV